MRSHFWRFLLVCLLLTASAEADTPATVVRKSLVRITVTTQDANYKVPWVPGNIGGGVGAGFVIDGKRIMTNAHVVSNARFLIVEKDNDPKKYIAHVQFVGHDCDLAVLKIEDEENFFKGTIPLQFGGLPEIESTVTVYGYPIGGERMSVTNGLVSRIDFQLYTHSGIDSHLTIQTSAPINPGNSGGPVMQDGKVVGVAFQGYSGDVAQNTGYMIPTPVTKRFLKDIEDGHYKKYMDLSVTTFNLQNQAMRRALGLQDDDKGVMVSSVASAGCSAGVLQTGDVLLAIDGHSIASDAFVDLDSERVQMAEIVERKFKGDEVKLHILRDKKEMDVTVHLNAAWPFNMQANSYDHLPRYVLFGGLLFQPLSRDFIEANGIDDLRVRFMYDYFITNEIYLQHPEIIVLCGILPDPINTYLGKFRNSIVDEVNGVKISTLKDLAAAFAKPADQYVIKVLGTGLPIVLERKAVESARERIAAKYSVEKEQNITEAAD
jgi:S1-C subfamily serine protease